MDLNEKQETTNILEEKLYDTIFVSWSWQYFMKQQEYNS